MLRTIIISVAMSLLVGFSGGVAGAGGIIDDNTRDYAKFTCKDLLVDTADDIKKGTSKEEAAKLNLIAVVMWAHGYVSQGSDNTEISIQDLGQAMIAVGTACKKPTNMVIVDIVRQATGH